MTAMTMNLIPEVISRLIRHEPHKDEPMKTVFLTKGQVDNLLTSEDPNAIMFYLRAFKDQSSGGMTVTGQQEGIDYMMTVLESTLLD